MRFRLSALLAILILSPGALRAQPEVRWSEDLDAALVEASERRLPLLVHHTVGTRCEACRALETRVFESAAYAARAGSFVHVRLVYSQRGTPDPRMQLAAARADLRGYPTVYALDPSGWPYWVMHGYEGLDAGEFLRMLDRALPDRRFVARQLAKGGDRGFDALLRWYGERDMPLGKYLAAERLFPKSDDGRKARLAPLLVGPAIVEKGASGAEPFLKLARTHDPKGRKGVLQEVLFRAGNLHLRGGAPEAAIGLFEELVALGKVPPCMRLEAEMGLGFAYRRLEAPCIAREHYHQAVSAASALPRDQARSWRAQAERRLASLTPCAKDACRCAEKRPRR